jgi:crotonobetainyl-CoA:carnitine CoA-transferase CaiB-like acyl-CoA transferase
MTPAGNVPDPALLAGVRVVALTSNIPGPVAAARLRGLGAEVIKVEPPEGDPLASAAPAWYAALHAGGPVVRADLKTPEGQATLAGYLAGADLLLTSQRLAAVARLGLDWDSLHARYPALAQVAIVGYGPPADDRPGHDLTYQADLGLLTPPGLPRVLLADLAGAERAVSTGLALLLSRARGGAARCALVALAEAAAPFDDPWRYGLTTPGGVLGGGFAGYGLYPARDGWIAVAALEPGFQARLCTALALPALTRAALEAVFRTETAAHWAAWAADHNLPLALVTGGEADAPR